MLLVPHRPLCGAREWFSRSQRARCAPMRCQTMVAALLLAAPGAKLGGQRDSPWAHAAVAHRQSGPVAIPAARQRGVGPAVWVEDHTTTPSPNYQSAWDVLSRRRGTSPPVVPTGWGQLIPSQRRRRGFKKNPPPSQSVVWLRPAGWSAVGHDFPGGESGPGLLPTAWPLDGQAVITVTRPPAWDLGVCRHISTG